MKHLFSPGFAIFKDDFDGYLLLKISRIEKLGKKSFFLILSKQLISANEALPLSPGKLFLSNEEEPPLKPAKLLPRDSQLLTPLELLQKLGLHRPVDKLVDLLDTDPQLLLGTVSTIVTS